MFIGANVTLMVCDLDRAVRFYAETLGLTLKYRSANKWAEFQAPGLDIGLHLADRQEAEPGREGRISIGLQVTDLDATVRALTENGVSFERVLEGQARKFAYFADPDHHSLYLYEIV